MTGLSLKPGPHDVEVDGGTLAVEIFPGTTAPVLAVHGLSSTRRLWSWLRATDPGLTLVAPDLRGRADSVAVEGPSSLRRHADDLVRVLDRLGLDRVVVCGMSMGAFIAVTMAAGHPARVDSLVLIDGGYRAGTPEGLTREAIPAVFADRLGRLSQRWDSVDDYLDYFVTHTAPLLNPNDPLLASYLEHDLKDGLVQLSAEAVVSDAADVFFGENPWSEVTQPIRFLHAEWSSGAGSAPAYPAEAVAVIREKAVTTTFLEGLDHAGSIMTLDGGRAAATAIRAALA